MRKPHGSTQSVDTRSVNRHYGHSRMRTTVPEKSCELRRLDDRVRALEEKERQRDLKYGHPSSKNHL